MRTPLQTSLAKVAKACLHPFISKSKQTFIVRKLDSQQIAYGSNPQFNTQSSGLKKLLTQTQSQATLNPSNNHKSHKIAYSPSSNVRFY